MKGKSIALNYFLAFIFVIMLVLIFEYLLGGTLTIDTYFLSFFLMWILLNQINVWENKDAR